MPKWAVDEALEKFSLPPSRARQHNWPRIQTPPRPFRNRRGFRLRVGRRISIILAITFVIGLYFAPTVFDRYVMPAVAPYLPGADIPPPAVDASDTPLGQPPTVADSDAFQLHSPPQGSSQPFMAYDPCRPVHYVIRPDNAPPGSDTLIREAVAEVSAASGLQFVYDGPSDEAFSQDGRERFQPDRYGKRWAPVLITWADPSEVPGLTGEVAGLGGSSSASATGTPHVLVAGQIALDAPALQDALHYPKGPELVRAVIIHELGHVLGLAHVDDPSQLMYGGVNDVVALADGDRAGLALLGTGECVPQV